MERQEWKTKALGSWMKVYLAMTSMTLSMTRLHPNGKKLGMNYLNFLAGRYELSSNIKQSIGTGNQDSL